MMRARVLVLEDDQAIQRFIALALNGHELDLVPCSTLAEARATLVKVPVQLLIMDMSLRDGSGLDLLHWLRDAETGSVHVGPVLVLSGGVDEAMQQRLLRLGVSKVLQKPISVADLESNVNEFLGPQTSSFMAVKEVGGSMHGGPVAEFFAGNSKIYHAYRTVCLAEFPADVRKVDEALSNGDIETLRRVAHNLKSVLHMLGYAELSLLAGGLEQTTNCGDSFTLQRWSLLRSHLLRLAEDAIQMPSGTSL